MRVYVLSQNLLDRCVVDPRPTLEAEARQEYGWSRALFWKETGGNWELHSVPLEQAPRKVSA